MFKGNRKYYFVLAAIFIVVIVLQYMQPKPIDWRRTYFKNDKIPFGCFAIYNLLESTYATQTQINKQTLYGLNEQTNDSGNTLIMVNEKVDFSHLDIQSLFGFLKKGNTVLICANDFGRDLKDTFKLETVYNTTFGSGNLDSLIKKPAFEIRYIQAKNNILEKYIYPQVATESYFTEIDTAIFKISSVNKNNKAVLLETMVGKGKLIIGSIPDVFGNLFIVNHKNRSYTYTLLSKVKNNTIIWDEYYKTYNVQQKGVFQFIFDNDALYMGYCILILGLLFFLVFEMKRKQRVIPVIKPLENSTLEFVDVISHVYFKSNNHKHIAEETIQYFYFDIRKKFQVNTNSIDEEFYNSIHHLSGIALDEVKRLFVYCQNIKNAPSLTQHDLLELNDRINSFKQKSMR